jgi:hypothetical protein
MFVSSELVRCIEVQCKLLVELRGDVFHSLHRNLGNAADLELCLQETVIIVFDLAAIFDIQLSRALEPRRIFCSLYGSLETRLAWSLRSDVWWTSW